MNEELVPRFFAALEAGDIDTVREIYARVEEYMDSAQLSSIRAAREAMSG
jgi:ketosteroid isomerase-like protein